MCYFLSTFPLGWVHIHLPGEGEGVTSSCWGNWHCGTNGTAKETMLLRKLPLTLLRVRRSYDFVQVIKQGYSWPVGGRMYQLQFANTPREIKDTVHPGDNRVVLGRGETRLHVVAFCDDSSVSDETQESCSRPILYSQSHGLVKFVCLYCLVNTLQFGKV